MRAPFIDTVIILDPLLVRRGEVRSQTPLESSRVYTYIPEDLTVGEKEMLETAARIFSTADLCLQGWNRDIYRYPGYLEAAKQAAYFSPFAYTIIRHPGAHISGLKFRVYMAGHD